MKHGTFNMNLKANEVFNGNNIYPCDPKRACMLKSQMNTMLTTSFDIKGSIHFEFIPQGQTVTKLIMWKY